MRHRDHRFEWTRAQFRDWAEGVASRFSYTVKYLPIIYPDDPEVGNPAQMGSIYNCLINLNRRSWMMFEQLDGIVCA